MEDGQADREADAISTSEMFICCYIIWQTRGPVNPTSYGICESDLKWFIYDCTRKRVLIKEAKIVLKL